MSEFIIPAQPVPSIAVAGSSKRFPVRRVFCVGRNYAAHAREMGKDPDRESPFFFLKPGDTVVDTNETIAYPPQTKNFQFEIELIVAIGSEAFNISSKDALNVVYGYTVGIDLTRRDLQLTARDAGRPWDWGKGFDRSAPIAPLHLAEKIGHPRKGRIWLEVNGSRKQDQDIADLIWDVPELVSIISQSMKLMPGDVIMTGTPAGVGPLQPGDKVDGGIDGIEKISIQIGPAA